MTPTKIVRGEATALVLPIAFGILTLLLCVLLGSEFSKGFDITDESFYLLLMRDYSEHNELLTRFHKLWGPVYHAIGLDIWILRILGGLFLTLAGFLLGWEASLLLTEQSSRGTRVAMGFIGAASTLSFYVWVWLPTPSYNLLNLLGFMLLMSGMLRAFSSPDDLTLSVALCSVGLFCMILAKVTSAALAVGTIFPLIWYEQGRSKRRLIWFVRFLLMSLALWACYFVLMEGPVDLFVSFRKGYQMMHLREAGGSQARFGAIGNWAGTLGRLLSNTITVLLFVFLAICWKKRANWKGATAILVMTPALLLWPSMIREAGVATQMGPKLLLGSLVVAGLCFVQGHGLIGRALLGLSLTPLIFTFGTDNPLAEQSVCCCVFLVLSQILGLGSLFPERQPLAVASVGLWALGAITLGLIQSSSMPYRQSTLYTPTYEDSYLGLTLESQTRRYFSQLQAVSSEHGLKPNTAFIDLTGASPGAIFALDGHSLGSQWLLGGGEGADQFAFQLLSGSPPEQLRRAWILEAPEGTTSFSPAVLEMLGLSFPQDYAMVVKLTWPQRGEIQRLWRPKAPEALQN